MRSGARSRGRAAAEPQPLPLARCWKGPARVGDGSLSSPACLAVRRQHTPTPSAKISFLFSFFVPPPPFPTLPPGPTEARRGRPAALPAAARRALRLGPSSAAGAGEEGKQSEPIAGASQGQHQPSAWPGRTTTFRSLRCGFVRKASAKAWRTTPPPPYTPESALRLPKFLRAGPLVHAYLQQELFPRGNLNAGDAGDFGKETKARLVPEEGCGRHRLRLRAAVPAAPAR